ESHAGNTAFLWTSSVYGTYAPSGLQSDGGSIQISYGPRRELLRVTSTGFYTNDFFGLFQSYYTNEFIYPDRFSDAGIEDYVVLATFELEGDGIASSSTTSSTYAVAPGRKILSSTSQIVSSFNGAVTSTNVVSSRYEKGYLVEQDSKTFWIDGAYTTESIVHF